MNEVRMLPAGERGIVIEFGKIIDASVNGLVHRTAQLLRSEMATEIIEVVPTYRSVMVYFDPLRSKRSDVLRRIEEILTTVKGSAETDSQAKVVYIPVCYGDEFGPDLNYVAQHNALSVEEVIAIHTSTPYLVYMIGFTPGFPYLGGMSERIATPRLEQPRNRIPAGSVGIAGSQTGIYPIASPGGWQLIGQTPVSVFNSKSDKPFLFEAGDYLQFVSISPEEYNKIKVDVTNGTYILTVGSLDGGGPTL